MNLNQYYASMELFDFSLSLPISTSSMTDEFALRAQRLLSVVLH